jgi:hypothetical protein
MRPSPGEPADAGRDATLPPSLLAALTLLRQAQQAALELHHDPWEFALGLPELLAAGLTGTEIRWLLASGLAEHALERVRPSQDHRSYRRMANLALTPRSCFVVTAAGLRLLERYDARHGAATAEPVIVVPHWDAGRRQLWYRDQLVKWYRAPAASQETILATFEEDGWPPRIDDPLSRVDGHDPHERLHEAVKGLNRGQVVRLLVFRRDGASQGVMWAAREGQ